MIWQLILGSDSLGGMVIYNIVVTFDRSSARMFSTAMLETYLSYHRTVWIAAADYYMYLHLIVLLQLTAILQFTIVTAS